MAELALDKVHVYARHEDPVTGEVAQRLVEHNPFLRLSNGVADAPIYIQHGQTYGEGGDVIPESALPDWFYEQLERCTDQALIAVGWKHPEAGQQPVAQQPFVYTEEKTSLLAQLSQLNESDLAALLALAQEAPSPPYGTPQTPISDIDADDFPADPADELLPSIPTDESDAGWTCPECHETMPVSKRGSHVRWQHPKAG